MTQQTASSYANAFHFAMGQPPQTTGPTMVRAIPLYTYRDFSSVSPEPKDDDEDDANNPPVPMHLIDQKLPVKMADILSRTEFAHIVSWLPHGRSFKIHIPHDFKSIIMPRYFEHSNYRSFNRLLNAWSFRRMSHGRDKGSYYHELFLRGMDHLHRHMRRLSKTHRKLPHDRLREPDFWSMPCLKDSSSSFLTSVNQQSPMMNHLQEQQGVEHNNGEMSQQQAAPPGLGGLMGYLPSSQENTMKMGFPTPNALDVFRQKQQSEIPSSLSKEGSDAPLYHQASEPFLTRKQASSALSEMLRSQEILHSLAVQEQEAKVRRLALIMQLRRSEEAEARSKQCQQEGQQVQMNGEIEEGAFNGSLPSFLPSGAFDGSLSPSLPTDTILGGGTVSGPLSFNARMG